LIKDFFYEEIYLPNLIATKTQSGLLKAYNEFYKLLAVRRDYATKKEQYELTVTVDNPDSAIKILEEFIVYINNKANVLAELLAAERKMIQSSTPQVNWLSELLWTNELMKKGINITTTASEPLIQLYRKDYSLLMNQLTLAPVLSFYAYNSSLQLSNTAINKPLKATLILGVAGGLLLGFIAASLRMGFAKSRALTINDI
jgi:hypothetical protein